MYQQLAPDRRGFSPTSRRLRTLPVRWLGLALVRRSRPRRREITARQLGLPNPAFCRAGIYVRVGERWAARRDHGSAESGRGRSDANPFGIVQLPHTPRGRSVCPSVRRNTIYAAATAWRASPQRGRRSSRRPRGLRRQWRRSPCFLACRSGSIRWARREWICQHVSQHGDFAPAESNADGRRGRRNQFDVSGGREVLGS